MKIRIQGNSIRYRLTRSEVITLCDKGQISEQTFFKNNVFNYRVQSEASTNVMKADFKEGSITLYVPEAKLKNWDKDNRVGFSETLTLPNNEALSLLLEKDFVCLDRREEDQSDQYPNPKAIL
ncbi:DUF7009 family protein [Eudoraea sp.]|uniref:DUF7009 family protein n=1 Tax=Eudoraea sp. TaxID=1979955 RepID=UPI003C776287